MDQKTAIHILIGVISLAVVYISILLIYYYIVATRTARFRKNFFTYPEKRGIIYLKYTIPGKEGAFFDKVIVLDISKSKKVAERRLVSGVEPSRSKPINLSTHQPINAKIKVQIIGHGEQTGLSSITKKFVGGQLGRRFTCTVKELYPEKALQYLLKGKTNG